MQLPLLLPVLVSAMTLTKQKVLDSWDLKRWTLFKNDLNNTKNNMKSQIQKKKKKNNGGIVELLIP